MFGSAVSTKSLFPALLLGLQIHLFVMEQTNLSLILNLPITILNRAPQEELEVMP